MFCFWFHETTDRDLSVCFGSNRKYILFVCFEDTMVQKSYAGVIFIPPVRDYEFWLLVKNKMFTSALNTASLMGTTPTFNINF
jgi:hypothetical protein